MKISISPFCLYFILHQSKKGYVRLEISGGTKEKFIERIEQLGFIGSNVLEKDCIEKEFSSEPNDAIIPIQERLFMLLDCKKISHK